MDSPVDPQQKVYTFKGRILSLRSLWLGLFGLGCVGFLQFWVFSLPSARRTQENLTWSWGHTEFVFANAGWLNVLAAPEEQRVSDGQKPPSFDRFQKVLSLDPDFYAPYRYAPTHFGIVLDDAQSASEILSVGIRRRDEGSVDARVIAQDQGWLQSWTLDAQLGFFLAIELGQLEKGHASLKRAMELGAPSWVTRFAENLSTPRGALFAYSEWLAMQIRQRERGSDSRQVRELATLRRKREQVLEEMERK